MANYNWGFDYPMTACGDQNSNQYKFVQCASGGTNGRFELATGGSNPAPVGVLQDDPESLNTGAVRILGVTKLMADAEGTAIGYGDWLVCGSVGMAVATTTGSNINAMALEALASGSGVYITALLLPGAGGNMGDNVP